MKSILFFAFLMTAAACAQTAPPRPAPGSSELPPDTVVATFGSGQKITVGELMTFINAMPPQMQQNAMHNRKEFVQQFVLMHYLAEMAEKAKLDQRSPIKDSLAFNRMYVLMNAQLHEQMNTITVPPAEAQAFYDKNKDRFAQVKVKTIYVSFSAADDKKHLTETEAQAKIGKLRTEILGGADFVKLVKENSDDQTSASKDGDFGVIRHTDNLPDAIRKAIFALKAGQVSEPVRQPNGFYLFRAEEISPQPYGEVQQEILTELRQARFSAWMEETKRSLNVKFENDAFVTPSAATTASK